MRHFRHRLRVRLKPRFREPTSGFTHLAGAMLSLVALLWLVRLTHTDPPKLVTILVFGATTILLYSASAAYHLVDGSPKTLNRLVRFDRVGIYLLIAGTYTPVCYVFMAGVWRWLMLGAVWITAIAGSLYVVFCFQRGVSRKLPLTLTYVAMGLLGVIGLPQAVMPAGAVGLIALGGLVYLVGTVVYSLDRPNLHRHFRAHDLWHVFVLAGSVFFFTVVFVYIAPA